MSRHRHFHNMNYDNERDDYDDEDDDGYMQEEDVAMSPSLAQFVYRRQRLSSSNNYTAPQTETKLFDFIPSDEPLMNDVVENDSMFDMEELKAAEQASLASSVSYACPPGFESQFNTTPPANTKQTAVVTPPGFSVSSIGPSRASEPAGFSISRIDTPKAAEPETPKPKPAAVAQLKAKELDSPHQRGNSPSRNKNLETPKGLAPNSSSHRLNQLAAISSAPATPRRERKKQGNGKELVNLVVVGHVDAGKSTLMGHVLYKLGCVDQRTLHKYKQESARAGKASFAFAWVLDETEEERSRGVTMDIARTSFETDTKKIVLLDAPGHKDFIPNMITGASQADGAILVVNATIGEFETGFEKGGQTREHAMLLRSLGVSQLIVAVNKLDTVDWDRERYVEVETQIRTFLEKNAGFSNIKFVPVSGLGGDNLIERVPEGHPLKQWYFGECLAECIDQLKAPQRTSDGPLRAIINDIFKATTSQLSLSAKIECGEMCAGDTIYIMPNADLAVVKAVTGDDGSAGDGVLAGDQALLTLNGQFEPDTIHPGHVITRAGKDALIPRRKFLARIVVFDVAIPIMKGTKAELFCHSLCEPVTFKKLLTEINKSTGKVVKEKPRCLSKNQSGTVVLETDRDVAVEAYTVCKTLGRITIRSNGQTVAAGIIEGACD